MRQATSIALYTSDPGRDATLAASLRAAGHRVALIQPGGDAPTELRRVDVIVCDDRRAHVGTVPLLHWAASRCPGAQVVFLLPSKGAAPAIPTLEIRREHIAACVERIAAQRAGETMVGDGPAMRRLHADIEAIAPSDASVLLHGESGSGKELVARDLHRLGNRRTGPFVAVNCAVFPETLLDAELFGHERGAFTGAARKREGRFVAADGGTLFLDEVAEMPLPAQAKLLRVLQDGTFEPLGTNETVRVDVRVLSATHRDLAEWVERKLFRADLYYRLKVFRLVVPPLRARTEDIPKLVAFFLARHSPRGVPALEPAAERALLHWRWPGNVRELEHAVQHAVVLSRGGPIQLWHLPEELGGSPPPDAEPERVTPLAEELGRREREHIVSALRAAGGNRTAAARLLGISRKSVWEKMRTYGIEA